MSTYNDIYNEALLFSKLYSKENEFNRYFFSFLHNSIKKEFKGEIYTEHNGIEHYIKDEKEDFSIRYLVQDDKAIRLDVRMNNNTVRLENNNENIHKGFIVVYETLKNINSLHYKGQIKNKMENF